MKHVVSIVRLGAITLWVGLGVTWTAVHLGEFPHYGDTGEYLHLSKTLEVDGYRGLGYPAILALADRWFVATMPGPEFRWETSAEGSGEPCAAPRGLISVQLFQLAVSLLALLYFLRVLGPRRANAAPAPGWVIGTSAVLVTFDPLIQHYNLSLMADGPALSLTLVYCGALVDLVWRRRSPTWLAAVLVFTAFFGLSALRVEKRWILLATSVVTLVVWRLWERRVRGSLPPGWRRRQAAALALAVSALLAVDGLHAWRHRDYGRWPSGESLIHLRIVYPHLSEIYSELPERSRSLLRPADAELYDSHLNGARRVVRRATRDRPELRGQLARDLAAVALRRCWKQIAVDIARDFAENVAATPSFYLRLAAWETLGFQRFNEWFHSDGSRWIHSRFRYHHPRLSAVYLVSGAILVLVSAAGALGRVPSVLRRLRRDARAAREALYWVPLVSFCLLNAAAFAATQNLVQIRYTLASHAVFVLLAAAWLTRPADARTQKEVAAP